MVRVKAYSKIRSIHQSQEGAYCYCFAKWTQLPHCSSLHRSVQLPDFAGEMSPCNGQWLRWKHTTMQAQRTGRESTEAETGCPRHQGSADIVQVVRAEKRKVRVKGKLDRTGPLHPWASAPVACRHKISTRSSQLTFLQRKGEREGLTSCYFLLSSY